MTLQTVEEDRESSPSEESSSTTAPTTSTNTIPSSNSYEAHFPSKRGTSRMDHGIRVPLLAVGTYHRKEPAPILAIASMDSTLGKRIKEGSVLPHPAECDPIRASPSVEHHPTAPANKKTEEKMMRGPPPSWLPPAPPDDRHDYTNDYEDPEDMARVRDAATASAMMESGFMSPTTGPINSYEMSLSQQRRSQQSHVRSPLPTTWEPEPTLLQKNAEGAYYIPSGSTRTTTSTLSPASGTTATFNGHQNRYRDPSHPTHSVYSDASTALLKTQYAEGTMSQGRGYRPTMKTSIKPMSQSQINKRKLSDESSQNGCWWKPSKINFCLLTTLALAILMILILLFRAPSYVYTESSPSARSDDVSKYTELGLRALPSSISIGEKVEVDFLPKHMATTELFVSRTGRVQFNATVGSGAQLVMMTRAGVAPSLSLHDALYALRADRINTDRTVSHVIDEHPRQRRSIRQDILSPRWTTFEQFMLEGRHYLTFINERNRIEPLTLLATHVTEPTKRPLAKGEHPYANAFTCDANCNNRGECVNGKCRCAAGFTGDSCEEAICPVVCSGNGVFSGGVCVCREGFKGRECEVRSTWCEVADCNGRGKCMDDGRCRCDSGWTGDYCDTKACAHPTCNDRGVCVNGKCYCEDGWRGADCSVFADVLPTNPTKQQQKAKIPEPIVEGRSEKNPRVVSVLVPPTKPTRTSPPTSKATMRRQECSGHGYELDEQCNCDDGWTGENCEDKSCSACRNGDCINGICRCWSGFKGADCSKEECPTGCQQHGKCLPTGACQCQKPWNGENCYLSGCPNDCSTHGECIKKEGDWQCKCQPGRTGKDCSIPVESHCDDGLDNDNDGLADCDDPDCCGFVACTNTSACLTVMSPVEVLLRMPPTTNKAFAQKVKFLLPVDEMDNEKVQKYITQGFVKDKQIGIISGRVVWRGGASDDEDSTNQPTIPLSGVRVDDESRPMFGFTMTRADGRFDLVVDGGRSVRLKFMKNWFTVSKMVVFGAVNEFTMIDDVVMVRNERDAMIPTRLLPARPKCQPSTRPVPEVSLLSNWQWSSDPILPTPGSTTKMVIDSSSFTEFIPIAGTSLNLVYDSSRSPAAHAPLFIGLLDDVIDESLRLVHLKIDVAGHRFNYTLAPRVNLTHVFTWNRMNTFRQSENGLSPVTVNVGYEYAGCNRDSEIVWIKRRTEMLGATSRKMEAAAWTVDVHHHLNVVDNILELGSGGHRLIGEDEKEVETIVGFNVPKRAIDCGSSCSNKSLYRPTSIAYALDGSLLIADHNLVRRISVDGTNNILVLSESDSAHPYFLAVNPLDGTVAISLPMRKQVWKIVNITQNFMDPNANHEVLVGDGTVCQSSSDQCGDGGLAQQAQLIFPKGITYDHLGNLYVADSRRVRVIDPLGTIRSIGDSAAVSGLPDCSSVIPLVNLKMEWPTSLASDPSSGIVYILDSSIVYGIDPERNLAKVVLGSKASCPNATMTSSIKNAVSIAAGTDGSIFVVESDEKLLNQVKRLSPDRTAYSVVVGGQSHCSCDIAACDCDNPTQRVVPSSSAALNGPAAVTISLNGTLVIADTNNAKIKILVKKTPRFDPKAMQYELTAGERNEKYFFNRHGHHVSTVSLITGKPIFNFTYNHESTLAKLTSISGPAGLYLKLTRPNETSTVLESATGRKTHLQMSVYDMTLESVIGENGYETKMFYTTGGLLKIRQKPASTAVFHYDEAGRATELDQDDENWRIGKEKVIKGRVVSEVYLNGHLYATARMGRGDVSLESASTSTRLIKMTEGFSSTTNGVTSLYDSQLGPLHDSKTLLRKRTTIPSVSNPQRRSLTTRWDWRYVTKKSEDSRRNAEVGTKPRINGVSMFSVSYDVTKRRDTLKSANDEAIMTIDYEPSGHVQKISYPGDKESKLADFIVTSDSLGRRSELTWGNWKLQAVYDSSNRIVERSNTAAAVPIIFTYKEDVRIPTSVKQEDLTHQVIFDNTNRVKEIKTPSGEVNAYSVISLGADKFVYKRRNAFSSKSYHVVVGSVGEVLEVATGDEQHHYMVQKDQVGRTTMILNDEETTKVTCWINDQPLCTRSTRYTTNATTQGDLVVARTVRLQLSVADPPRVSTFSYEYDDLLRPVTAQFVIEGTALEPSQMVYDEKTGHVTSLNGFAIFREQRVTRINGHGLIHEIVRDGLGQVVKKQWIAGSVRIDLSVDRDAAGRSIGSTWNFQGDDVAEKRIFDARGRVASVETVKEKITFGYNKDSRLVKMNDKIVEWHSGGVLKSVGDVEYKVDENGWISERNNVTCDYDALGRITVAEKKGIRFEFVYDHQDRMVAFTKNKELTSLFYGNPLNSHQITHFTTERHGVAQLLYSDHQTATPFAIFRNGYRYGIATDEFGSLRHVISDSKVVKSVDRDVHGKVLTDSDPSFWLPIGFLNGLEFAEIDLVVLSARPYDTISGRHMSYHTRNAFTIDFGAIANSVDLYAIEEKLNPNKVVQPPQDLNDWFVTAGLSDHLLPSPESTKTRILGSQMIVHRLLSSFPRRLESFTHLNSVVKSPLNDESEGAMKPTSPVKFSIEDSGFSSLFVLPADGKVDILPTLTEPEKNIVEALLKNTNKIPIASWNPTPTRHVQSIHKSVLSNLTSSSLPHFTLVISPKSAEIRNGKSKIITHFGRMESIESELIEEMKKKEEAMVWRFERKRTEASRRSRFVWTERQKRELHSKATVTGFTVELVDTRKSALLPSIYRWRIVEKN